jgi:hypothetical protein
VRAENAAHRAGLLERLLALIERGATARLADAEFEELALAVFAHQFACNAPYRAYCAARAATPATVANSLDVPAVPTDAFKAADLVCGDPADAAAVFRTSGTTAGRERRGTHYLLDTALYLAALRVGFRDHLVPDRGCIRILSLVPAASERPDSSLSFMVDEILRRYGAPGSGTYVEAGGLVLDGFLEAVAAAVAAKEPVLIAGTSFAFVHLLDALAATALKVALPAGSRAMDTGGFKGLSREVGREELYTLLERRLGIPQDMVVNEYGMTEMSSQLYDGVAGQAGDAASRTHAPPAWVRSVAVDPETLRPLSDGQVGILKHLDLANLDSVMALQTADLGRVREGRVELLGRAEGAAERGCSIAMDELLQVIGRG